MLIKVQYREMSNRAPIEEFQYSTPTPATQLRSIILFGNNVASYKFALAQAMLELAPKQQTIITLDDLALPFALKLCKHLKHSPKQATSTSSRFLDACSKFNTEEISSNELKKITVQLGFNNVLDAFHIVNRKNITTSFFEFDKSKKRVILTDDLFGLAEDDVNFSSLFRETESRWNLVETAWANNVSRNLLTVSYDNRQELLYADQTLRRKDVTSARGALNGYQKGKCFYCGDNISIEPQSSNLCDVDHFFPHCLQKFLPEVNLNGVWNLVLSCRNCNRGEGSKFAQIPDIPYLQKLYQRNEYLISSHHPLRETLMLQTGMTSSARRDFIKLVDQRAINIAQHRWIPKV